MRVCYHFRLITRHCPSLAVFSCNYHCSLPQKDYYVIFQLFAKATSLAQLQYAFHKRLIFLIIYLELLFCCNLNLISAVWAYNRSRLNSYRSLIIGEEFRDSNSKNICYLLKPGDRDAGIPSVNSTNVLRRGSKFLCQIL